MAGPGPSALEPLEPLARFSRDWAPVLCDPAHGCCGYHRAWSSMRLFDQDGQSPAGWRFFVRELARLPRGPSTRVLISGGADTGLTAIVATALPRHDATIVFADRCDTTVQQNLLFARHLRRPIEAHLVDARALDCEPVDAVVAHSFLITFDPEDRRRIVANWARLLKPGGVVLMSNRVAPDDSPPPRRDPDAVVAERLPVLLERARSSGILGTGLEDLEATARAFWNLPSHAGITETHLREILTDAGLEIVSLAFDHAAAAGPMTRRHDLISHPRAEIVARKPEGGSAAPART